MVFYTYLWLRENGTPYYAGKGQGDRAFRKGSPPRERVLVQEMESEQEAFQAERFLIAFYGRKDLGTGILRNFTDGGEGASGWICTEENRRKLAQNAAKGGQASARLGQIQALGRASARWMIGRKASVETRRKMSASSSRKYHPHSPEAVERLRQANIGRIPWNKGKKGLPTWNKGRKCPQFASISRQRDAQGRYT